eukprot:TRINITY_DN18189_c0_g1_i1.p1 TRINITY_DN18189_c0_g1~~TRINITY_DN18189_c0_g1_i1.p1  ORF type:complete len:291 (+),score=60.09 TRINITY_DN18189_c0_g1_i1:132-1004(+)
MLGFCCCGASGKRPGNEQEDEVANARRRSVMSIRLRRRGSEAERFDVAIENNDLPTLVRLLDSQQAIECSEQMHPWAENPRTVGTLAAARLAMLAQEKSLDLRQATQKQRIGEAGAVAKLVNFLRSGEADRVQTAVVALSFLTYGCSRNAVDAYEAGAMPLLLKHLSSKVARMRGATATLLRNLCMEDDGYRREFVELGGLASLVKVLGSMPVTPGLNISDVQLEVVLAILDIIESEDGASVDEECAAAAREAGAVVELRKLLDTKDQELRFTVEELLASLTPVQPRSAA